jgi:hypothetical protein
MDNFGFDYFWMAISTVRMTIAIALILGLISAVLYVTTQNMHISGQRNESSESSQQRCTNTRECAHLPTTSPNISSSLLFVYLKEGGIAGPIERTYHDSPTEQLIFLGGLGDVEQTQIAVTGADTSSNAPEGFFEIA